MVNMYENLLSEKDLFFLDSLCSNFVTTQILGKNNYYVRKSLNIEEDLLEYQERCSHHLPDGHKLMSLWINKVTNETNIDDDFHYDGPDLTIISFINEGFEGGEFEYIFNNEKIKIQPKINHSLMINKKIKHRVLNVVSGCRFSLISFYIRTEKNQKTLI